MDEPTSEPRSDTSPAGTPASSEGALGAAGSATAESAASETATTAAEAVTKTSPPGPLDTAVVPSAAASEAPGAPETPVVPAPTVAQPESAQAAPPVAAAAAAPAAAAWTSPPPAEVPPAYAAPSAWEVPAEEVAGPAPGYRFGGGGIRLVAYIIDTILIGVLMIVAVIAGVLVALVSPALGGLILILGLIVPWLAYFPWFWVRGGQTPGLRMFGLRVVRDRDGGPVGVGAALLRLLGLYVIDSIVLGIPLGLLWLFFDKRKRCWHDLLAGTVVIGRI